jgi:hypothetical protein
MMSKLRLFFLIILTLLLFFKCKNNHPVPEVYVNFYRDLNNPMFQALNSVGGSVVIRDEGYKGVIITRTDFDQFAAYDATCTYDPNDKWGRVVPQASSVFAKDTVCGSSFILMYGGYPDKGPARIPLKMYVVKYNQSTNTIFVHN